MGLNPGTRLGPYEVLRALGAGGMGEVYSARDTRLDRTVAVKVLPSEWAADASRRERFEREARAIAALNHPHICTLHDVGRDQGVDYLVMELVEGESLANRLQRGPLPLNQAVEYAIEIAAGLDRAHRAAIIHRDLKPANIMLTRNGAKLLDFGLAKLRPVTSRPDAAATTQLGQTEQGTILGTTQYMAPEQVEGGEADARTDIFALGTVIFESVTGRRPTGGSSPAAVMTAILRDVPPAASSLADVPASLDRILRTCLQKDPEDRWQTAADLGRELRWVAEEIAAGPQKAGTAPTRKGGTDRFFQIGFFASLVALTVLGYAFTQRTTERPTEGTPVALSVLPPDGTEFASLAVSPDGHSVAFTTAVGAQQLWVQRFDSVTPRALPGTDGAMEPFWSPDGQSIGFFAENQLKTVPIAGGRPTILAPVQQMRGGSWGRRGDIIYAPNLEGGLMRISAAGGAVSTLTNLDAQRDENTHRWPSFLPDGRHYLYWTRSTRSEHLGVYLGSIDGEPARHLFVASTNAVFVAPGSLVYLVDGVLMQRSFNPQTLQLEGEPRALEHRVGFSRNFNRAALSASETGTVVFWDVEGREPRWFDRSGKPLSDPWPVQFTAHIWLSNSGQHYVFDRPDSRSGANDIVISESTEAGVPMRFTADPASDVRAIWLATDRIVWSSNRIGTYDLYWRPASGASADELLFASGLPKYATSASADGKFLLFETDPPTGRPDVWLLPLEGPREPCLALGTEFVERQARLSPDGRKIAYVTDRDGTNEVYVTDFDPAQRRSAQSDGVARCTAPPGKRVSSSGGSQPMWRSDGKELFFLAADAHLMAQSMIGGSGAPQRLFQTDLWNPTSNAQLYAVSTDGLRFLLLGPVDRKSSATVILNWPAWTKR